MSRVRRDLGITMELPERTQQNALQYTGVVILISFPLSTPNVPTGPLLFTFRREVWEGGRCRRHREWQDYVALGYEERAILIYAIVDTITADDEADQQRKEDAFLGVLTRLAGITAADLQPHVPSAA